MKKNVKEAPECNYFTYKEKTDKLFYGVPLTEKHMNVATEELRAFLIDGGAADILYDLDIGIRVIEKENTLFPELNETVSIRFIYLEGERKNYNLTIDEIVAIGLFLKHGPYYGKIKSKKGETA